MLVHVRRERRMLWESEKASMKVMFSTSMRVGLRASIRGSMGVSTATCLFQREHEDQATQLEARHCEQLLHATKKLAHLGLG